MNGDLPTAPDRQPTDDAAMNRNRSPDSMLPRPVSANASPATLGLLELVPEHDTTLEVRIDGVLIHRAPIAVAAPLRYLLTGTATPIRLGVTSSVEGEGVTMVSRSLAALIAHDWRASTCWIDLNWWKTPDRAGERQLFGYTIADAMTGMVQAADLPRQTSIPGLTMVHAGEVPLSVRSQLPRDSRLWRIVDDLGSTCDYVVLDLPPVLTTSDSLALSKLGDAVLLVVRQNAVSSDQVQSSLRMMSGSPLIGTLLNGARSKVPRWLRSSSEI